MTHADVQKELRALGDPDIAAHSARYFKTGKGEYGENDRFLGIRVPKLRNTARKFRDLSLGETEKLLRSGYHEARLTAIFILVQRFQKSDKSTRKKIYELYLTNRKCVNNWDLVDSSAPKIMGPWLEKGDRSILYDLVNSDSVWDRRIAVMSTLFFIRQGEFEETLALSEKLLDDPHDLIHKAVGWMLREVGNVDFNAEKAFLDKHSHEMPRTMLRYAIEKLPEEKRRHYLAN